MPCTGQSFGWFCNLKLLLQDESAIAHLASTCEIEMTPQSSSTFGLKINGHDVTNAIRTPEVTAHVASIAAQPAVRSALVKQQQAYGQQGGLVAEGRDMGTHVFPNANLKIFLTASLQERAKRRLQDMSCQGISPLPSLAELAEIIHQRDQKDSMRSIAPLVKADDAVTLTTDYLSIDQVVAQVMKLYLEINFDYQIDVASIYLCS